jgi:hypothetical protein
MKFNLSASTDQCSLHSRYAIVCLSAWSAKCNFSFLHHLLCLIQRFCIPPLTLYSSNLPHIPQLAHFRGKQCRERLCLIYSTLNHCPLLSVTFTDRKLFQHVLDDVMMHVALHLAINANSLSTQPHTTLFTSWMLQPRILLIID